MPEMPFSAIDEMKAGMYKGEKITMAQRQEEHAEADAAVREKSKIAEE